MTSIKTELLSKLQQHITSELPAWLEEALYKRESQHLVLNQHAIVSIADRAGNITYVNDKFCEVSGYSRDELTGSNHRLLKSGEHTPEFYQNIWHTIAGGTVWHGELCNRRKDGSLYWVAATISPILDDEGLPYQYVSIRTDISHIKVVETELYESKKRHQLVMSFANIGTWDWNIQTGKLIWSERIAHLFGHPSGELGTSYDNFLAAIHPDDRSLVIDAVNACIERDVPYEIEHRVVCPDGTVRWLLERGGVNRDASGNALQMFGVVQDITKRKQTEINLAKSSKELFDLKIALDKHAIVSTADPRGIITYVNEKFCLISKYTPEELIGQNHNMVNSGFHPHAFFVDMWQTISRCREWKGEIRNRAKDGSFYWVQSTIVPIFDRHGKITQYVSIRADITDRKKAEESLILAREHADKANKAKSQFLSNMSHELRTPMNSILGFAQLMKYSADLSDEHKDFVQEILKGGNHLLELINEVLDLAKVESGQIELVIEPVDVCEVIEECISLVNNLAYKRSIQISHGGLKNIFVRADRTRLVQILLNLLSNAVKYNREGGSVKLKVQVEGGDRLRILVTDTGQGIPADRLMELFQPFNRLDAENSGIEGTGIGLTITKRIAEMMGGAMSVQSEVGVGSTFWVELPLESMGNNVPSHAETSDLSAIQTTIPTAVNTTQRSVLYIEDNHSNINLVKHLFAYREHIHLLTAGTPKLGIELAQTQKPDLILLDINMPGMDGYQVMEIFKADAALKDIPVIAVTANAMTNDIERGRSAGFSDYLTKPLDVAQFFKTIDIFLENSKENA